MEQVKKAHKKVGKKANKLSPKELMSRWMMSVNDDLSAVEEDLWALEQGLGGDIKRMKVAIWALVIFSVVMAAAFLLVLFGNQYLIK